MERALAIVTTYLEHNQVPMRDVPELIESVFNKINELETKNKEPEGAVSVEDSISDDFLVCLEDGKKVKLLKRHLREHYNMSPEEYRKKWNLPDDYPMVAKGYAMRRSQLAKKQGLGKKAA
jgi:predicted transcriptional regulator